MPVQDLLAKTVKLIEKDGGIAGKVERYNHHCRKRFDLFGFGDVFALKYCGEVESFVPTIIQVTTMNNASSRKEKILAECEMPCTMCLDAGVRVELWAWRKTLKKPGGKAKMKIWQARITEFFLNNQGELLCHTFESSTHNQA